MLRKKIKQLDNTPLPPLSQPKEPRETPGEFAANMKWLQENWDKYKNLWVALNNGALVASAESRVDLQTTVDSHENRINIMCVKVGQDYMLSGA
jgi:hypothetical protein